MRVGFYFNRLIFKLVVTVIMGSISLAILLSIVNITISKRVFMESLSESQEKIFDQIDREFYGFYEDIAEITAVVGSNKYFEQYFSQGGRSTMDDRNIQYFLEKRLQQSPIEEHSEINVFVVGENEKSYMYSDSDMFAVPKKEIWNSDVARKAREDRGKIVCVYRDRGFTNVSKSTPVIVLAKAWLYDSDEAGDMVLFITIKEDDIRRMYGHFTSDNSDIILLNQDGEVVSSNNTDYLEEGSTLADELRDQREFMNQAKLYRNEVHHNGFAKTYLMQRLQSTNYQIMGVIDPEAAFRKRYNIGDLIWLTLGITGIAVILVGIFVGQQTKPIATFAQTMRNAKKERFTTHVQVKGTREVRELAETYNDMVEELNKYIQQLIQVEADKRTAEIHALQMQINPHYMYNTLASIKWLVWQGDAAKSTQVIDAFILLLRNVISNTDECITVAQEIENLQNYVLINQARYGDAIQVAFYVLPQCEEYQIPKLVLQPFVENAFFHAFPKGEDGIIQIFVKEEGEHIRFNIVDNGVGIEKERLQSLIRKEKQSKEHFTGIGIGNVDDRIKMIYGLDYGINIISSQGKGTTVTLVLPKRKNE